MLASSYSYSFHDKGTLHCTGLQVIRARENRPNRKLFSAWLQSAYIEVPSIELKRADLDKVSSATFPHKHVHLLVLVITLTMPFMQ